MSAVPLKRRTLGRTGHPVPPVMWDLRMESMDSGHFLETAQSAAEVGAEWFIIDGGVGVGEVEMLTQQLLAIPSATVVLGLDAADFVTHTRRAETVRMEAIRPVMCAAVMVQNATAAELRSIALFNRLAPLQDAGDCHFMFVAAANAGDATWMIEHSPVAAVMAPFGLADQTAGYRALPAAREHGMGLIARRPTVAVWHAHAAPTAAEDIAFVLAFKEVASVVEPFPRDREELYAVLAALRTPMNEQERLHWWIGFSQQIPERG